MVNKPQKLREDKAVQDGSNVKPITQSNTHTIRKG